MEKYMSPLRVCDNVSEKKRQEISTSVEIKSDDASHIMEVDLTSENSPVKDKPSTYVTDNKNKLKKLKLKKSRGEKRKLMSDKSDQRKTKRKKREEKGGIQNEDIQIIANTPLSKPILKKEGSIPAESNSNVENTEKTKQLSRKRKAISNKCKETLDVLSKLNSEALESMDRSLKIIKTHRLLSDKYITIDVLLSLISLALEKKGENLDEISLSLIVSKCLSLACVTSKRLKVKKSLINRSLSPKDKSLLEEASCATPGFKEELREKEIPNNQNLEQTEQIESEVSEKVQEKSGKNFCITNYFKILKKTVEERNKNERFSCFTTKTDMFLAPKLGGELTGERRLHFEEEFSSQQCESNYLSELISEIRRKKSAIAKQESAKVPLNAIEGDSASASETNTRKRVSIISVDKPKEGVCRTKAKLFQFHDNRRPPYWGTWRRKSETVKPRKPFGRDKIFNYEIDSDDEWEEEEEPGESLHGSDDEKEPEEDYEVDNDFFVPHGYLSDDENPEKENMSPKTKLDFLEEQFTSEIKQKTRKMTPIVFGTFWTHRSSPIEGNLYQDLQVEKLQYVPWTLTPVEIAEEGERSNENSEEPTSQVKKSKKKIFPNEEIPTLIKMIHGSPQNSDHLARKFLLYWETEKIFEGNRPVLTKVCVQKKIKELAAWQASQEKGKMCWQVPKETREEFGAQVEKKTPEKKPRKCFIWKFVRKAEKNPPGVGNSPSAFSHSPSTPSVEREVVILET